MGKILLLQERKMRCSQQLEKITKKEMWIQQNESMGNKNIRIGPSDGHFETISFADYDLYSNIKKLLVIGCVSPIVSTETERVACGVRRLKTQFCSTMGEQREFAAITASARY